MHSLFQRLNMHAVSKLIHFDCRYLYIKQQYELPCELRYLREQYCMHNMQLWLLPHLRLSLPDLYSGLLKL